MKLAFAGGLPVDQGGDGAVGRQVAGQDVSGPFAGPDGGAAKALGQPGGMAPAGGAGRGGIEFPGLVFQGAPLAFLAGPDIDQAGLIWESWR